MITTGSSTSRAAAALSKASKSASARLQLDLSQLPTVIYLLQALRSECDAKLRVVVKKSSV